MAVTVTGGVCKPHQESWKVLQSAESDGSHGDVREPGLLPVCADRPSTSGEASTSRSITSPTSPSTLTGCWYLLALPYSSLNSMKYRELKLIASYNYNTMYIQDSALRNTI